MGIPRLRATSLPSNVAARETDNFVSDEVELYHRTYTTLLRSSGEMQLRVLEPSHAAMQSSLHPLAGSDELDLGAFIYATRRLPTAIWRTRVVVMGQEADVFERHNVGEIDAWTPTEAPARRRRWYYDGDSTLAVLLASTSDLDDLVPSLVAYQIEWNKLRARLMSASWESDGNPSAQECAKELGGTPADWTQLFEAWEDEPADRFGAVLKQRLNLRVRMLGGSQVTP